MAVTGARADFQAREVGKGLNNARHAALVLYWSHYLLDLLGLNLRLAAEQLEGDDAEHRERPRDGALRAQDGLIVGDDPKQRGEHDEDGVARGLWQRERGCLGAGRRQLLCHRGEGGALRGDPEAPEQDQPSECEAVGEGVIAERRSQRHRHQQQRRRAQPTSQHRGGARADAVGEEPAEGRAWMVKTQQKMSIWAASG